MESLNSLAEFSNELARAVEIGGRAVVAVYGRPHIPSSGVILRPGIVVTTDHTLKRDEELTVTSADGRNVPATLAGRDGGTDLAVLRVAEDLGEAARQADAASVKAGNFVLALGRRSGDGISASFGVVSATGTAWRTWRGGQIDAFIRPDVNVYYGFSGGALVDVEGRLIGVNTTGLTRGGPATIPAATVARVADELLSRGHVRRGYLGVGLHPVRLPDGQECLMIVSLEPEGPGAKSGLFLGDVLMKLEGEAVSDTDDVQKHLGGDRVGRQIEAQILRGGSVMTLRVVPGERPSER